jgi:hypothetical protein
VNVNDIRYQFWYTKDVHFDYLCNFIYLYWQTYFYIHMKQNLLRNSNGTKTKIKQKLAVSFNHTYRYIDDVLLINNHNFHNDVHLIYPNLLHIYIFYLILTQMADWQHYMTNVMTYSNGRLTTLYDKRDDF